MMDSICGDYESRIHALEAENQRLKAEVEQAKEARLQRLATLEDIALELGHLKVRHEQYREWAAGHIEHLENLRTEHLATIEALRRQMERRA